MPKAYADITTMFAEIGEDEVIEAIVRAAVEHELMRHAMDVDAPALADVFPASNGMGPYAWNVRDVIRHKSGSVGDVVINAATNGGWVTMRFGYHELSAEFVRWFQTRVTTNIRIGESLIASASPDAYTGKDRS